MSFLHYLVLKVFLIKPTRFYPRYHDRGMNIGIILDISNNFVEFCSVFRPSEKTKVEIYST
jgi:hypothetical protein